MKNSILLEGLQDTHSDFEFARRQWDKLGLGVNFDDAYNAYYKKNYDPEHWDDWRDPVYSEEAWNELVQSASGENESLRRKQEKRFEDDLEEAWDNPTDYANYFLDNGSDINEIKATLNKDGHNSEDFLSSVLDLMDELAYNNYEDDYETYGNSYSDEYEYADPDPEAYDAGHAEEWTDKHPYGYYNNESDYGLDDDMDWEGYDESLTEGALNFEDAKALIKKCARIKPGRTLDFIQGWLYNNGCEESSDDFKLSELPDLLGETSKEWFALDKYDIIDVAKCLSHIMNGSKSNESLTEGALSNGSYSLYNGWIKVPDKDSIPDVDMNKVNDILKPYVERFKIIKSKIK